MKKVIHKADERGVAEHGWLHSKHSFSFASYYNQKKMGFGLLRVLNDDIVEPGQGFGTHPHDNMEIISVILKGALEHKDSMGTGSVMKEGDIQLMSAGTGVTHSEFNHSNSDLVNFLQLWIFPKKENIEPKYQQKNFPLEKRKNKIVKAVSGEESNGYLSINQDAAISLGSLEKGDEESYKMNYQNNGAYLFVLEGSLTIDNELLNKRDAIGIYDTNEFTIEAEENSEFIIIEVPME